MTFLAYTHRERPGSRGATVLRGRRGLGYAIEEDGMIEGVFKDKICFVRRYHGCGGAALHAASDIQFLEEWVVGVL